MDTCRHLEETNEYHKEKFRKYQAESSHQIPELNRVQSVYITPNQVARGTFAAY